MLVTIYQSIYYNIPEDSDLNAPAVLWNVIPGGHFTIPILSISHFLTQQALKNEIVYSGKK